MDKVVHVSTRLQDTQEYLIPRQQKCYFIGNK
jgi:hypothetical protein